MKTILSLCFSSCRTCGICYGAGGVFQALFGNPLASSYTLGVSNGAGFGAALAIVLSLPAAGV